MGRLNIIKGILYKAKGAAPGKAVVLTTKAAGGQERETELYHPPGLSSGPTPEDIGVEVSSGTAGRVTIAAHNYKLEIEVTAGETILYSTSADGETLKSTIKLDTNGNILLNGDSKTFVTFAALNTALQGLITGLNAEFAKKLDSPGAPGLLSLDISAAETTTVKTGG